VTNDPPALLTTRGVAKTYGSVVALRSVDLTVRPGEIHALLGANGAGKSTLVKILSGVIRSDGGEVTIHGDGVALRTPSDSMASGIATVFQDPALIPHLNIAQNLRIASLSKADVQPWLDRMGLGRIDFEMQVADLPLAMLRLLDLARALARDPELLMLDEITAALTPDQADHVFGVMKEWKAKGLSVLFISHRLSEVLEMCDTSTILRNGTDVEHLDLEDVDEARLVTAMLGEELGEEALIDEAEPAATRPTVDLSQPVVFEVKDVHLRDKVNGISFQVRKGEILGLTALEGQGQEGLFQMLSGDFRPTSGEILVHGEPLNARSPYNAIRKGLAFVPADRQSALFPQRSVQENLSTPLYNRIGRWFTLASDESERVARAVDRLDIDVRAGRQVQRLSGGNQQKVTIGRWLACGFDTLLCFDPTRGIDIQTKAQIYDLLRELADDGAGIVLYTSELREIPLVCDRVLVMYGGRIVHEQAAATATEEALLTAAHGLEGVSA